MTAETAARPARSRFGLLLFLVVLLAFAVREQFVLVGIVDYPIRGDIREYFAYAWNLVQHGSFSHVAPGSGAPVPDAYRSPGYPWLLAACLKLWPQDPALASLGIWYPMALQLQVLLGTASVLLATLLARSWLAEGWALFAGVLLALWPHHIAATGALLSEVAFGFTLLAGTYCLAKALQSNAKGWWAAAGGIYGYAYLINPLILFFPPMLAALLYWKRRKASAGLLLAIFLLPVALLALRNASIEPTTDAPPGRAAVNFVQGSWPNYHAAHSRYYSEDPVAVAIMQEIGREAGLLETDPPAGLSVIGARLARDPAGYASWYAWDKPRLLWDWNIRLGFGGVYFQEVHHSPLDRNPLRALVEVFRTLNPVMTMMMMLGGLAFLFVRDLRTSAPGKCVAALALYLTVIHVVFQAEPRYANAYRGIEVVLVATALSALAAWIRQAFRRRPAAREQVAS